MAAFSVLRRGELFGLRREHVDLERGTVIVTLQRPQAALRYQLASAGRDRRIVGGISELIRHERGHIRPRP